MSDAGAAAGHGWQPYIATRAVRGRVVPHPVQGLVVRDYARRAGVACTRLPAVEYAMPGCYMMLEDVLDDLANIDGIVCYSLFMLPGRRSRREDIYRRVFDAGRSLHGALESIAITGPADVARIEDIFAVTTLVRDIPASLDAVAAGA